MSILFPIFVIPFLIGALIFLCFRTKKTAHRVVLICASLACIFVGYASTNPIPGNEGPGLLAFMYVSLTVGAAVCLLICRFLPKPLPLPRSPIFLMSGCLLATFGISAAATFPLAIFCGSNYEGAALSITVVIPLLWGFVGWLMPKSAHPKKVISAAAVLLLWSVLFSAFVYWQAASSGVFATVCSILTLSHRTAAPVLFSTLFYTPQSAFGLEVLRPLAVASTQFLLSAAFGIGMVIKTRKECVPCSR